MGDLARGPLGFFFPNVYNFVFSQSHRNENVLHHSEKMAIKHRFLSLAKHLKLVVIPFQRSLRGHYLVWVKLLSPHSKFVAQLAETGMHTIEWNGWGSGAEPA